MIYPTKSMTIRQIAELKSRGEVKIGGHFKNKIYGTLDCPGARRWIAKGHYLPNRVFFRSRAEAIQEGFRPCAQCMPDLYREWKTEKTSA